MYDVVIYGYLIDYPGEDSNQRHHCFVHIDTLSNIKFESSIPEGDNGSHVVVASCRSDPVPIIPSWFIFGKVFYPSGNMASVSWFTQTRSSKQDPLKHFKGSLPTMVIYTRYFPYLWMAFAGSIKMHKCHSFP